MIFTEKFELNKYGEEFKNSYILVKLFDKQHSIDYVKKMYELSKGLDIPNEKNNDQIMDESQATIDFAYQTVEEQFVEGLCYNRETKTEEPMKKEDLIMLPPKIVGEIMNLIRGSIQKKN